MSETRQLIIFLLAVFFALCSFWTAVEITIIRVHLVSEVRP